PWYPSGHGPPVYAIPDAIEARPSAAIGQPPTQARYAPNAAAIANAPAIARFIAAAEIRPAATARTGPMRSGPSAPRSASKASFAKFVPIWIASAPASAASAGPHAIAPAAWAAAVPTATGTTAAGSVRGRAAEIHARIVRGTA